MSRKEIDRLNNFLFSVFHNDVGLMAKRIELAPDGALLKKAAAQMWQGRVETRTAAFDELPVILAALTSSEALGLGVCDRAPADIVTTAALADHPEAVARSKKFFTMPVGSALGLFDCDTGATPDELIAAMEDAFPPFASAAKLIFPSTSAGICIAGDDKPVSSSHGVHLYFVLNDGADFVRFGAALCRRLWLKGYGRIEIAEDGKLLVRQIIDGATFAPERIVFEAAPILGPGLERHAPAPRLIDGGALDTSLCLDLTPVEKTWYENLVAEAKRLKQPEADDVWEEYKLRRGQEISRTQKIPIEEAIATVVRAKEGNTLAGNFPLHFEKFGEVLVDDVLSDLSRYDKQTLLDPLEPGYRSRFCAIFYANDGLKPTVYSQAHGGQTYFIGRPADLQQSPAEAGAVLVTVFPPLRFSQLKALEINPDDYILGRGLLRRGQWTLFTGGTGIGKSVAVDQFAGCIAGGRHIFGLTVSRPFKVLLLTAEDDEEVLKRNFVAIADHEKLDPALLDANLQIHHAYALDGPELHDAVAAELARGGFDLVILDNYQAYSGANDLNDSAAWNLFIKPFERMLKARRAAMLLVDHTGKPVERKGWGRNDSVYLAAGTSRKSNGARASIELYSPTGNDDRYRLHFGKNWERAGVVNTQNRLVRDVYLDRAPSAESPYWTPSADQGEHRADLEGEEDIVRFAANNLGASYNKIATATGHSKSKVGRIMLKYPHLSSQQGSLKP